MTASLKVMLYERFEELVIVAVDAKVVSEGPKDVMVTKPWALLLYIDDEILEPEL